MECLGLKNICTKNTAQRKYFLPDGLSVSRKLWAVSQWPGVDAITVWQRIAGISKNDIDANKGKSPIRKWKWVHTKTESKCDINLIDAMFIFQKFNLVTNWLLLFCRRDSCKLEKTQSDEKDGKEVFFLMLQSWSSTWPSWSLSSIKIFNEIPNVCLVSRFAREAVFPDLPPLPVMKASS